MTGKGWIASFKQREVEKREKKKQKYSPKHQSFSAPAPETKSLLAPLDLSDDLVTVSVPVFNTPPGLLERAIGSILRGSHRHVRVVAVSDGDGRKDWKEMSKELREDPRLVCVISPTNMGPYFNHDAVLRAASGPFFAVQDSDDVSHHKRLELQLKTMHEARAEAVHSPVYECDERGRKKLARCEYRPGPQWAHRADHFGLYSRAALLELGGYYAGFRLGYDTNLTSFLNLLAKTCATSEPLYTRHQRAGSLTRNGKTGYRSRARDASKEELRVMWGAVYQATTKSRRAGVDQARSVAAGRASQFGNMPLRDDLVKQLKALLGAIELEPPPLSEPQLQRLLAVCHPDDRQRVAVHRVYRYCERTKPPKITTLGSPMATAAALCHARMRTEICCLEADTSQRAEIRKRMSAVGLGHVQVEQKTDPESAPGLLIIGEKHPLATVGTLRAGTEVWLPASRADEQRAELPGRSLESECGMIRIQIEGR